MGITVGSFLEKALLLRTLGCFLTSFVKQAIQMRIDIKARLERVLSRIGCHLGTIEVQLFAPHQSCLLALLHNCLKELAKDVDPITFADTGQTRMVWQRLAQIIPNVPANAEPIRGMAHQQPFRANTLKKHHQLQFEEDDGVNRGTTTTCIGFLDERTHKREIKRFFQMPVEVILWNQRFQGHIDERSKLPLFHSHHRDSLSPAHNDTFLITYHLFSHCSICCQVQVCDEFVMLRADAVRTL